MKHTVYAAIIATAVMLVTSTFVVWATATPKGSASALPAPSRTLDAELEQHLDILIAAELDNVKGRLATLL